MIFQLLLLMEEILHQLIWRISHYRVLYIPGGAGFLPSTVCGFTRAYYLRAHSLLNSKSQNFPVILRGFLPAQSQSTIFLVVTNWHFLEVMKIGQMTRKSPTIFQLDISLTFSIDVLLMEEILHHLGSIKS